MRGKSLLAFALAIGCGLVAMVGVQQVLKKNKGNPDSDKVTVFVAATEIQAGETLDMNMLEKRKFLKGSVPKEAVIDPKQLEKRALIVKVMPGDIIRVDKLGAEGKTGASISIPKGMRVVSVPTNTTQAHSGMLQPGDRVDVMVSYRVQPPKGRDYPETKTILGRIQVFATDAVRDSTAPAEGSKAAPMKTVSLLVTPEQAQVLVMAQNVGTLHLSLRNVGDEKDVEIKNLTPDEFRDQVVLNGVPLESDEPDPSKQDPPRTNPPDRDTAESEPAHDLNDFLDDASGKKTQVAAAAPVEPDTEAWDIAFYGKAGVTVETVEIPRQPKSDTTPQASKTVMGSLLNMFQTDKDASAEAKQSRPADTGSADAAGSKKVGAKATTAKKNSKTKTPQNKPVKTKQVSNKTGTSSLAK
jgi:pilus assembly protein CpaB